MKNPTLPHSQTQKKQKLAPQTACWAFTLARMKVLFSESIRPGPTTLQIWRQKHTGPTHEHVRSKFQCVTMNVILAPESPNTIAPNLHPPYPGTSFNSQSHFTSPWPWRLRNFILVT
jgi:hypothetical protein